MSAPTAEGQQRAEMFRHARDLGSAPIPEVADLLPCDVTVRSMPDDLDAVIARDPETDAMIVAVNMSESPSRQRFTIAHELGHIEFDELDGTSPLSRCVKSSPAETRASSFARNLLLPIAAVRLAVGDGNATEGHLSDLVHRYGVSAQVAAIQLRGAGAIDDEKLESWSAIKSRYLAHRYGWSTEYEAARDRALTPTPPRDLLRKAMTAYFEGKLSVQALAHVRGVTIEAMRDEIDEMRSIEPAIHDDSDENQKPRRYVFGTPERA